MINGNEIIQLMCKPMSDENVLKVIKELGMEVPLLDETYEIEEVVSSRSSDEMIFFEFEEIDGYSTDGDPCLSTIELEESKLASVPFDLSYSDDYETCCKKIDKEGAYDEKMRITTRYWTLTFNDIRVKFIINFTNEALESIGHIMIIEDN